MAGFVLFGLRGPTSGWGQSAYLPINGEEVHLLERIEIQSGRLSPYFFSWQPISAKEGIAFINGQSNQLRRGQISLSATDHYNIGRARSIHSEWVETADGLDGAIPSKHPIFGVFYNYQPDLIHVHNDDFFLVVNPTFYTELIKENRQDKLGYLNTRGIEARGLIKNKVAFYTFLADDQTRPFSYVSDYERRYGGLLGKSYYHRSSTGNYDVFLAKAYIDAAFFQDHLSVSFGYDQQMTGVGIRSLVQSDVAPPATFLRLRGRLGAFGYQSLLMELTADRIGGFNDTRLTQKYAAIHQLAFHAGSKLDIGLFESTVLGPPGQLKWDEGLPVIGFQSLSQLWNRPHQSSWGLWFKAIALKRFQFYGQGFLLSLQKGRQLPPGARPLGLQLGTKYINAFSVPNLDLQLEANAVRPFTYAAPTGETDYTHYNQPLPHPLGAGFAELLGRLHYQPVNRLYLDLEGIYSLKGTEAASENNGLNPMAHIVLANPSAQGWLPGPNRQGLFVNANAAYEIRPNVFLELGYNQWNWSLQQQASASKAVYGGLRWNMSRKVYDSY